MRYNLQDTIFIPCPMKRRPEYLSLHEQHQDLAVEVDYTAMRGFGRNDPSMILYADLQSSYGYQSPLRLGSGRSGYFGDYYLKGIGRTTLAGNWLNPIDVYHGTGHLCASAAAREYLVTAYLKARGLETTIIPCEGILVRPLEASLQNFGEEAFSPDERGKGDLLPADRHIQAISVKRGGFLRLSHLTWYLNHPPGPGFVRPFLEGLINAASGSVSEDDVAKMTPQHVTQILDRMLIQGIRNFLLFFRSGVCWGSTHNNFAADGRFLDLELPTILGGPFYGHSTGSASPQSAGEFVPLPGEVWDFVMQVRSFSSIVTSRLAHFIRDMRWLYPNEKVFAQHLCSSLDAWRAAHDADGLFSIDGLITQVIDCYESWGLSAAEAEARKLIPYLKMRAASVPGMTEAPGDLSKHTLRKINARQAQIEPFHRRFLWSEMTQDTDALDSVQFIQDYLEHLDHCTDAREFLTILEEASLSIRTRTPKLFPQAEVLPC